VTEIKAEGQREYEKIKREPSIEIESAEIEIDNSKMTTSCTMRARLTKKINQAPAEKKKHLWKCSPFKPQPEALRRMFQSRRTRKKELNSQLNVGSATRLFQETQSFNITLQQCTKRKRDSPALTAQKRSTTRIFCNVTSHNATRSPSTTARKTRTDPSSATSTAAASSLRQKEN
jgi:hypothetical protein